MRIQFEGSCRMNREFNVVHPVIKCGWWESLWLKKARRRWRDKIPNYFSKRTKDNFHLRVLPLDPPRPTPRMTPSRPDSKTSRMCSRSGRGRANPRMPRVRRCPCPISGTADQQSGRRVLIELLKCSFWWARSGWKLKWSLSIIRSTRQYWFRDKISRNKICKCNHISWTY